MDERGQHRSAYDSSGGFPGAHFMAGPVIGGPFAPLALERACGGEGAKGLKWLDEEEELGGGGKTR